MHIAIVARAQVSTVSTNAPRTVLNLREEAPEEAPLETSLTGESASAQDVSLSLLPVRSSAAERSRLYKQCLLELERLAALWLDVEQLDARLADYSRLPQPQPQLQPHLTPLDTEGTASDQSPVYTYVHILRL